MGRIENDEFNISSNVACVLFAAVRISLRAVAWYRQGFTYTQVSRQDGLRCHDTRTSFHKDLFRHSEIDAGDRQYGDLISLTFGLFPLFCQNNEIKKGKVIPVNRPWRSIRF